MNHWSTADIADAVEAGLRRRAAADDAEQAVYGFDALDELGLHPFVQEACGAAGWGVWPEQRYPGHWHKRKRSEGLRCDLVLTPDGLPLRDPQVKATLFDAMPATDAESAFWLEVKTVAQFETAGPFRRYAAELLSPVAADIKKLSGDGVIRHGGLLLVLFTRDEQVAAHDFVAWHRDCLRRGHAVELPSVRGFPITNRIGNGWCGVGVFGVRCAGG